MATNRKTKRTTKATKKTKAAKRSKKPTKKSAGTQHKPFFVVVGGLSADNQFQLARSNGDHLSARYWDNLDDAVRNAKNAAVASGFDAEEGTSSGEGAACVFKVVKEVRVPKTFETKTFK